MYHEFKCKTKIMNSSWPWIREKIFSYDTNSTIHNKKLHKSNFTQIKNFYTSKDTTERIKRQTTDREEIFAEHISDKEISKIIKNSQNSIMRKQTPPLPPNAGKIF